MSQTEALNLWTKVDYGLVKPEKPADPPESEDRRTRLLRRFWSAVLDVIATVFWVYAVLKVFVANVDQSLFGNLAQYRFFLFVGVAALIAIKVRSAWTAVAV